MGVPLRSWAAAVHGDGPRWSVYREFPPDPATAAAVACGWHGRAGWARSLRVLPDGCVDLVWNGRDLGVVSTAGEPLRMWLPASAGTVGLRLRCGAAGSLLGRPMSELSSGTTPLRELWGQLARRAEDVLVSCPTPASARAVLEELVALRLRAGFVPDRSALRAVRGLGALKGSAVRMVGFADTLGVSERSLRRHLRHEVGCGPKRLHQLLRFHRFLGRLRPLADGRTALAVVAAELGYADQSHLGRECRRFSGSSPGGLVRAWRRHDGLAEKFQTAPDG
ncbi:helix-turn-helix domain-containing protein [Amycolatopsis nigrescens]|uniref:helix-turn-helix domain-containing protein n=1 Tax=Amycolatopsis nigrescens TaxID=381445 RepID=UPI00035D24FF|nr:helix-turn-helix domain-containing protein [Amycolatopsis nigrescens]